MYVFTLPIQYDTKVKKRKLKTKTKNLTHQKSKSKKTSLSAYTMVIYTESIKSLCIK